MSKHINYIEAINAPTLAALIASLNEEKLIHDNEQNRYFYRRL